MWTPRRVFLVMTGVMLFGAVYAGYAKILGWVDGLPPLPENYTHPMTEGNTPLPVFEPTTLQARLRLAFGPNCIEQQPTYAIKLEVRDKGILFAAMESKILDDGRVQFMQLSVAVFGKNQEISTLHCDRAILEFDQPVRKIEDMGSRKVLATELHADPDYPTDDPRKGKVHITNNRRTPKNPDDDLIVKSPGPIFYRDDPNRPLASDSAPPPRHPSIPTRLPHIWTYSHVELIDKQNRPLQNQTDMAIPLNTVTADGMRMYLIVEAAGAEGKKAEKNGSRVAGVERLDLDRNVLMNLWSDSSTMFGDKSNQPAPAPVPATKPAPPAEKSLITIQTDGSFFYDMSKDLSHFERPELDPQIPRYITVTRRGKGLDTLTCEFLDIQFRRKKPADPAVVPKGKDKPPVAKAPPADGARQEAEMDMEWVHAWGKDIAMSSEAEKLDAYGYDLVFDATAQQTVLKGRPMVAVKEGNQIKAKELILSALNDREKQKARAVGPGEIGMGDFDVKKGDFSRKAIWQDELNVQRVKENGKEFELLLLTGGAEFRDTMNAQNLSARQLKLWLIPNKSSPDKPEAKAGAKVEAKKTTAPKEESKQPLPYRLEATGDVRALSTEMIIHDADHLDVWFKDIAPGKVDTLAVPAEKPIESPAPRTAPPPMTAGTPKDPLVPIAEPVKKEPSPRTKKDAIAKVEPKKDAPPVPIEMRHARRIITWVNRTEGKNDLDKVHCEGKVVITQKPTAENKNGVRIEGNTVDLEHYLEGNNLIVVGNEEMVGQVHFDTIAIVADDINIDQRRNEARVKGRGWMQLQSATKLVDDGAKTGTDDGKNKNATPKKEEKSTPIEIQWDDSMEMEGPTGWVLFEGNVEAAQQEGALKCENMQVKLDRPVWLNNANRPAPKPGETRESPKVERILCDQAVKMIPGQVARMKNPVSMQDREIVNGKLTKFQMVSGTTIDMDNIRNIVVTHGVGATRIFGAGSKDPLAEPIPKEKKQAEPMNGDRLLLPGKKDPPAKSKADEEEMKLTLIEFKGLMKAYNKERRVVFLDNVDLTHFPSERHDVVLKPGDPLPEGGMHIFCEKSLEMRSYSEMRKDAQGKDVEYKWQEMAGEGNVRVRSEEYTGWATRMTYSEDKGLLIFYGDTQKQLPALLTKAGAKGQERKKYQGEQIKYWTKTKNIEVIGGLGGSGN